MRVYVAGPLTTGNWYENVRTAVLAADRVQSAGHTAFVPHISGTWELICPHDYDWWMKWCLSWVEACDVLLRLPGDSHGADIEVAHALEHGLRVFNGFSREFWDFLAGSSTSES